MTEYEIYLPTAYNDGTLVDPVEIESVKARLARVFGGYTHLLQRSEGLWSIGGVSYRDQVTIIRVLDDGTAGFDMVRFKTDLEARLRQQSILIVQRDIRVV